MFKGKSEQEQVHGHKMGLEAVYKATIKEIDRYRDWPIRVLAFELVLFLATLKALLVDRSHLGTPILSLLVFTVLIITAWTIAFFVTCRRNYLKAWQTQAREN